jgi:hypothetical protein
VETSFWAMTIRSCAFYEPVYYNPHFDGFPSNPNEELGQWAGVETNVGDALTFKLLTSNQKVIFRSVIRPALDPTLRHKRLGGEKGTNHAGDKIFVRSNTYNQILDFIEQDNLDIDSDTEQLYRYRRISAHQGPLRTSDRDYKGSTHNVLSEWESGETTYEPLDLIAKDNPVTCTEYAGQNGLLDTPGWKRFKHLAKNQKKIEQMVNQAKAFLLQTRTILGIWLYGSHNTCSS